MAKAPTDAGCSGSDVDGSDDDAPIVDVAFLRPSNFSGLAECLRWRLSEADRVRAEQLTGAHRELPFLVAHVAARVVVAHRWHCAVADVDVRNRCTACGKNDHGKPWACVGVGGRWASVSISYSGDLVAVAVGPGGILGVDVEVMRPVPLMDRVAERFFDADDVAWIASHADPISAYLRCWTRREAYVKAIGRGLLHPFSSFRIVGRGPVAYTEENDRSVRDERIVLVDLAVAGAGIGSLACSEYPVRVHERGLTAEVVLGSDVLP